MSTQTAKARYTTPSQDPNIVAGAAVIAVIRDSEDGRCTLSEIMDDLKAKNMVPWNPFSLVDVGASTKLSAILQGLKNGKVLRHTKEGWVFYDEATRDEIIQNISTNIRAGVKRISNAVDDSRDHNVEEGLSIDLKMVVGLFDEIRGNSA